MLLLYGLLKGVVSMDKLTRRDFLKLAGTAAISAAAFSLPDFGRAYAQAPVIGSRQQRQGVLYKTH